MIAEPVTMLTDYALAGVSGWLAYLLFRAREGQVARLLWAFAFAALAASAALGGTYHGLTPMLAEGVLRWLWKLTVLAVGVASFGMFAGSTIAVTTGGVRKALLILAAVKLALYSGWMLVFDDYIFVIVDTGVALMGIAALHVWSAIRRRDRASAWMLGGAGVSVLAAAVQAGGFDLHKHFNHNDLYHVIQIAAMFVFYASAKRLRDCGR